MPDAIVYGAIMYIGHADIEPFVVQLGPFAISFKSAVVARKYAGEVHVIFCVVPFCQTSPPLGEVTLSETP